MPKGQKVDSRSSGEKSLQGALDALKAKIKGQKDGATDAQKAERSKIANQLKPIKFVRIANKRIPRSLASIKGVGALGSYAPTVVQKDAIAKALRSAVDDAVAKLGGQKEAVTGFELPTT